MSTRKSSKSSVPETSTSAVTAKAAARKRAERNKVRTNKHVGKMLSLFATGVVRGYEDQDWRYMSQLFRQLSPYLMLEEVNALGKLWRTSFAEEPSQITINNIVGMVADRLGTQFAIDPVLSQRISPQNNVTTNENVVVTFQDMTMESKSDENYSVEYVVDDESDDEDAPKASKKSKTSIAWD